MSFLTPILNPVAKGVLQSITGVTSRFFTEFDEVAQSYIQLGSDVSLTGDFEISVDIYIANVSAISGVAMVLGNSQFATNALWVSSAGEVNFRDSSNNTLTTGSVIESGKLHRINLLKQTGLLSILVDGIEALPPSSATDLIFNRIGIRRDAEFPFTGIISNVKAVGGSTTALDMPIDQNYTPTNNTVLDLASGNNGTFVNVADGDSTFYELIGNSWVDSEGNALEIAY